MTSPPQQPTSPPSRGRSTAKIAAAVTGVVIVLAFVITAAVITDHRSKRAASSAPPAAATPDTVAYSVSGGPADVSYGPAGSQLSGSAPMEATGPLGSPAYYYIWAQLQGGGNVSCQISVNGTAVSQALATADNGVAHCEIIRDLITGQWRDANGS